MSNVVHGSDMVLECKVSGTYYPIGCATDCEFNFNNEIIGKTDVNAGLFRKKRVRISDSQMSVSGLTTLENDSSLSVFYFLQEGVRRSELDIRIRFKDEALVEKQIQGIMVIESIRIGGQVDDFSEFDISFQGTGPVTQSDIDPGDTGLPGQVLWDWWDTTPGEFSISGPGHYGRSFAGQDVLEVDREGTEFSQDGGNPPSMALRFYDGVSTIYFNPDLPFNPGTRVFAIWQEQDS